MNLATYTDPAELYLARGDEVNPNRPLFTGDVFAEVAIPGVQGPGTGTDKAMGMIVAHPCSFRIGQGQLEDRILVSRVEPHTKQGASAWRTRFLNLMPLTDLKPQAATDDPGYWVAHLELIGLSPSAELAAAERIACLSERGLNILQQRLTAHLTRTEVPTEKFYEAFAHTFDEADLLEEWTDTLVGAGWIQARAVAEFETFIRDGDPSLQRRLENPSERPFVRRECRQEATKIVSPSSVPPS